MIPKSKRFKKGSFYQTILLGLLFLIVIGFLIFSNWQITRKRAALTTEIETLKKEIQILEEKNQELQAGIAQTQEEDYWKKRLYEQGYVEKGEQQVVILPPKEEELEEEKEKSFWNPQTWWEWIKDFLRD